MIPRQAPHHPTPVRSIRKLDEADELDVDNLGALGGLMIVSSSPPGDNIFFSPELESLAKPPAPWRVEEIGGEMGVGG